MQVDPESSSLFKSRMFSLVQTAQRECIRVPDSFPRYGDSAVMAQRLDDSQDPF